MGKISLNLPISDWVARHSISVTTTRSLLFVSFRAHWSTLAFFRRIRSIAFDFQPMFTLSRTKLFDIIDGFDICRPSSGYDQRAVDHQGPTCWPCARWIHHTCGGVEDYVILPAHTHTLSLSLSLSLSWSDSLARYGCVRNVPCWIVWLSRTGVHGKRSLDVPGLEQRRRAAAAGNFTEASNTRDLVVLLYIVVVGIP